MHVLVQIEASNHARWSDNEGRNLPGVHSLLSPHRAVALLLSPFITNGSAEFGDPKADAVSICHNVFQPLFKYRQRFSNEARSDRSPARQTRQLGRFEFCEIITRPSLSFHFLLSTFYFIFIYFFSNRKREREREFKDPFHINLHRTVDTTLMITTHHHHHHHHRPPPPYTKLRPTRRSLLLL